MPQRHGPDTFFNFPGCSAAVSLNTCIYFLPISLLSDFIWCSISLSFLDCPMNENDKIILYVSVILLLLLWWWGLETILLCNSDRHLPHSFPASAFLRQGLWICITCALFTSYVWLHSALEFVPDSINTLQGRFSRL